MGNRQQVISIAHRVLPIAPSPFSDLCRVINSNWYQHLQVLSIHPLPDSLLTLNPRLVRQLLAIAIVLFLTFNLWAGYWGVAMAGTGLSIGVRLWKRRLR